MNHPKQIFSPLFSILHSSFSILHFLLLVLILPVSCTKDTTEPGDNPGNPDAAADHSMGWNINSEDKSKYPSNISFQFSSSGVSASLPAQVDLTGKLPPAGEQGNYSTCITWSVGYGLRSYLNAVSNDLTPQQLTSESNQFSPADLWMSITAQNKTANCGGSNFESAFDAMVNRGIATLQTAPYSSLQCDGTPPQAWTTDAANHKIMNYRMIADADMTVSNLKTQLAQGRLIAFGARVGDNFITWRGDGVMSSDTYNQPGMQSAYHAMVLAGYDDSKGSRGAFLVYNSWGLNWGDKGCMWVDYNFFLQNFVFIAFVVTSDNNVLPNSDNEIDPNKQTSGPDLAAYNAYDVSSTSQQGYNRQVYFNIYNIGDKPVAASNRWSVIYMYYNAFNANDYGILTHLYFTDEISRGQLTPMQEPYVAYAINMDIPAGKNIAAAVFDQPYEYMYVSYYLPPVTGYYYLVVMADPFNCVQEVNKQNNYFFIADANGYPYYFQNGVPYATSSTSGFKSSSAGEWQPVAGKLNLSGAKPMHSPVTEQNRNAYTPDEIRTMIMQHKQAGDLDTKIRAWDESREKAAMGGMEN